MSSLIYYLNRVGLAPRRRRLAFYEREASVPDHSSATCTVEVLNAETLARLDYCGGWLSRDEASAKIAAPRCWMVGAHRGGRLIGYVWGELEEADVAFFDLRVPLPARVAYLSHVFVAPEARGSGLYLALCAGFMAEAVRRGASRVFLCVDPANTPMIRQQPKLGFRHYLSASYLRLGPWRRYRIETPAGAPVLITGSAEAAAKRLLP